MSEDGPGDAWSLFDGDEPVQPAVAPESSPCEEGGVGPVETPELGPAKLRLGAAVPLSYTLRPLIDFFMQHCRHTLDDLELLSGATAVAADAKNGEEAAKTAEAANGQSASVATTPAAQGAATLLDALKAANEAVTMLDECRRKRHKIQGRKGPAAVATAAEVEETEARALDQLRGAGDVLVDTTWAWLRAKSGWPHVAWREAYVHGQLCRAVAVSNAGDPLAGMHAVDLSLIMGAPAAELTELVNSLEMACTVVKAANAAAEGTTGSSASTSIAISEAAPTQLQLPTIPALLGPDAELDIPDITPEHSVVRVAAMTVGPAKKPSVSSNSKPTNSNSDGAGSAPAEALVEHPRLAALRAMNETGKPLPLPDFRKRFVKANKPVVLCGVTRNWAAIDSWRDLTSLVQQHGHRTVPIEVGQHLSGYWREEPMTLRSFVATYLVPSLEWGWGKKIRVIGVGEGSSGSGDSAPTTPKPDAPAETPVSSTSGAPAGFTAVHPSAIAYLAQHGLFEQLPALTKEFDIPVYAGNEVGAVNAWFGTAGTVTRCHYDDYENLFAQVVGYKLIRLYAPADSDKMYRVTSGAAGGNASQPGRAAPAGAVEAPSAAEPAAKEVTPAPAAAKGSSSGISSSKKDGKKGGGKGKADQSAAVDATLSQGNVSAVDVEHPDLTSYPLFAGAHHYDVILGPGDVLYIPKGWWHYVRSLTPSFSCNFWW